ncbi:MAG: 2-C-methyl-D-erythritol 2,4-cyclodiphosphate synthase [Pseudomonadota bacterium]|nr:2-C-methyl-D-erythritol 2,4-cyclodiphosphate synthase [Pseudomonadota bacterium]
MSFCLIILAAGKSSRFNSNLPKVYHKIGNKSLVEICIDKAKKIKTIKKIILVYNKKDKKILKKLKLKNIEFVLGGKTRQISTLNALRVLNKKNSFSKVLIHDAARPNFSLKLLRKIVSEMKNAKAVIPKLQIRDAVKEIQDSSLNEYIISKQRQNLFLTQTPQCFISKDIFRHHLLNKEKYRDDDISLYMNLNGVKFIDGEKNNFKITEKDDFKDLKKLFQSKYYVGKGFDVHRLIPNRKLYLGGIKFKSKVGTLGHSDGDPVLHSIIDALLGATASGDIGSLFSDRSKKFKNIRSTILLKKVLGIIKLKGYSINNLDINIITQTPKIKKIKNRLIKNICKLCELPKDKVNIKGKTTEKLGLIGREKAIACEVISSVIKYD